MARVNPVYRTAEWRSVSRRVLLRDGYRCQIKLPGCRGHANSVDHILALDDGGAPYDLKNLQAACRPCNTSKANTAMAQRAERSRIMRRQW